MASAFSKANNKLQAMVDHADLQPFLANKRKVYSFDLLSGHSCPFASDCLAKVKEVDGKRKVVDGPEMEFRCFSASQEATYTNVYNKRKGNFDNLRKMSEDEIVEFLLAEMPKNLGICRIHVAGDFFSPKYFSAWIRVAEMNPSRLFYAYTKSLPYWIANLDRIPENMVLTASYGGRCDDKIVEYNLRSAKVVFSYAEAEALGLEIDHDDSHAANPLTQGNDFALILHGIQAKGSEAANAIRELRKGPDKFSYGRKATS